MTSGTEEEEDHEAIFHTMFLYPENFFRCEPDDRDKEEEGKKVSRFHAEIELLYNQGAPLFSREAIQDLDMQLKNLTSGDQKLYIRGLNDHVFEFPNETGRTFPTDRPELEYVLKTPTVRYLAFEHMVQEAARVPGRGYCNLQLEYWASVRNKQTNQLLLPPSQSYEEAKTYFEGIQNVWNESQSCKQLISVLDSALPRCKNLVGFALGQLSYPAREKWQQGSAFQHALLLTLRDLLARCNPDQGEIVAYAQDPIYNEIDKSLSRDYAIQIVDNPGGFLQVDDSSAVLSCGPNVPVKQIISDYARPALIICDRVREPPPNVLTTDPDSPRFRSMIDQHYVSFEFQQENLYFGSLIIYVRRKVSEV